VAIPFLVSKTREIAFFLIATSYKFVTTTLST